MLKICPLFLRIDPQNNLKFIDYFVGQCVKRDRPNQNKRINIGVSHKTNNLKFDDENFSPIIDKCKINFDKKIY